MSWMSREKTEASAWFCFELFSFGSGWWQSQTSLLYITFLCNLNAWHRQQTNSQKCFLSLTDVCFWQLSGFVQVQYRTHSQITWNHISHKLAFTHTHTCDIAMLYRKLAVVSLPGLQLTSRLLMMSVNRAYHTRGACLPNWLRLLESRFPRDRADNCRSGATTHDRCWIDPPGPFPSINATWCKDIKNTLVQLEGEAAAIKRLTTPGWDP